MTNKVQEVAMVTDVKTENVRRDAGPASGDMQSLVHRQVLAWIREDAGMAIKMSMTPKLADALTDRIMTALGQGDAPAAPTGSEDLLATKDAELAAMALERDKYYRYAKRVVTERDEALAVADRLRMVLLIHEGFNGWGHNEKDALADYDKLRR